MPKSLRTTALTHGRVRNNQSTFTLQEPWQYSEEIQEEFLSKSTCKISPLSFSVQAGYKNWFGRIRTFIKNIKNKVGVYSDVLRKREQMKFMKREKIPVGVYKKY